MPTLAAFWTAGVWNARLVMNSDTVNPMPARAATPTRWLQRTPSGSRVIPVLVAAQVNAVTPTVLPTTRPTTTPRVTPLVSASRRVALVMDTPALASANSGTIT